MEHRQGRRYKTLIYADIHSKGDVILPGIIHNISSNGMFVLCNNLPGLNESVEISLPIPDLDAPLPGFVIHQSQYGFGMMFRELGPAAHALVKKLIAR